MTVLKCKMCGGNIEIVGESHGICDSCGSEVTLPKIRDEKRAEMYNRGNDFRKRGDFDRAYSAYEHIIADNQADAEAHWCLTLCRYGVEYVEDHRTGEYKPTVSRMRYESILDDPDYLAALAASDEYTKELYRKEARKIEGIQRQYLEISRKEAPYDVFICFKATKRSGERTVASEIGQNIYETLTARGLKVFFSRITLAGKLGELYEPYIFAALTSAKVMVVVADEAWQLQERWVKNEWSRYLSMMDRDKSKYILPAFKGIGPDDFPAEIPTRQGQDMGAVGGLENLVENVLRLTGHADQTKAAVPGRASVVATTQNLMLRAVQAREDGAFEEAIQMLGQVLDREAENGEAYYNYFLAKNHLRELPELVDSRAAAFMEDHHFRRAFQYAAPGRKKELESFRLACLERVALDEAEELNQGTRYEDARDRLMKLEADSKKIGYVIKDRQRMQNIYASIEKSLERERRMQEEGELLRARMAEYKEELGDVNTYMRRVINKKDPGLLPKYEEMQRRKEKARTTMYKEGKGMVGLLAAVVMVIASVPLISHVFTMGDPPNQLMAWVVCACIGGSIVLKGEFMGILKTVLFSFLGATALVFVFSMLKDMIGEDMARIVNIAIIALMIGFSLLCLFKGWSQTSASIAVPSLTKKIEDMETKVLRPMEETIRQEVKDRWQSQIGKQNLVHLPGVVYKRKK